MSIEEDAPDEVIEVLQEIETLTNQGLTVPEVARAVGISEETLFRWKDQYAVPEIARRLRVLEEENARLRRIVAQQALDIARLKNRQPGRFSGN